MLRIRKDNGTAKIVVSMESECDLDEIANAVDKMAVAIYDGFEVLKAVCGKFDEVRLDTQGALHCRNDAPAKK